MTPFIERLMNFSNATPEKIAKRVLSVIENPDPPLRVQVTSDAALFQVLRRYLPRDFFHRLMFRLLPGSGHWGGSTGPRLGLGRDYSFNEKTKSLSEISQGFLGAISTSLLGQIKIKKGGQMRSLFVVALFTVFLTILTFAAISQAQIGAFASNRSTSGQMKHELRDQNSTTRSWRQKHFERKDYILDETLRNLRTRQQQERERKLKLTQHVS